MKALNTDYIVTHKLLEINQELASAMGGGDCVFINSAIISSLDDILRDEFEFLKQEVNSDHSSQEHLTVLIQTAGGYMETVERIVAAMRSTVTKCHS